jgi:hypothetical protein
VEEGAAVKGAFARPETVADAVQPPPPLSLGAPDRIEGMPLTDVLLVNVKLLTLAELQAITSRGAPGRAALDAELTGRGRLVSSLNREAAV